MVDDLAAEAIEAGDEEMEEVDSGDSSSSDSDFEELEVSEEDSRLLMKLEQQLEQNPNLYDAHVQVRHACRRPPPSVGLTAPVCC